MSWPANAGHPAGFCTLARNPAEIFPADNGENVTWVARTPAGHDKFFISLNHRRRRHAETLRPEEHDAGEQSADADGLGDRVEGRDRSDAEHDQHDGAERGIERQPDAAEQRRLPFAAEFPCSDEPREPE